MNLSEIKSALKINHEDFVKYILSLNEAEFEYAMPNKWSAGKQLEHIIKSVKPLNLAFRMPKFILKWNFGKANRPSKTYNELTVKYGEKLKTVVGRPGPARFAPAEIKFDMQAAKCQELENLVTKLCQKIDKFSEADLDFYIIPHPLLGKLTVREMLYFTAYHVQHHQAIIKAQLQA